MIYILIFISIFLCCCGIYLAKTLRDSEEKIKELEDENAMLKLELEESKAKEGKGILESTIDGICKAFNSINFQSIISEKVVDEYSTNIESRHCIKYDADCVEDCDFDCENCERSKLEENENE